MTVNKVHFRKTQISFNANEKKYIIFRNFPQLTFFIIQICDKYEKPYHNFHKIFEKYYFSTSLHYNKMEILFLKIIF